MIITLVLKSIKNSFRNFRKIYLLLIISQFVSVISIFFVYGIYTSYSAKMQELDIDSYRIGTSYDESCDIGTLKECLPNIMEQMRSKVDYLFISGTTDELLICMYTECHGGSYTLADIVSKNNILAEGRQLSNEDEGNENKVIYSMGGEPYKVGDRLNIVGTEFEVVGVDEKRVRSIIIPFRSCPNEVSLWQLNFIFEQLPTERDYMLIKNTLESVFGDKVTLDEFQLKDQETIISYRTTIVIAVAIGLLSALNTCLLYGYIICQRQKQMAIYGIVGASKGLRLMMNELEIMLVNIAVVIIGFVIFRFGVQDMITKVYENSIELYSVHAYLLMMGMYVVCVFVFTVLLLTIMNRNKLTDMLRRTKND